MNFSYPPSKRPIFAYKLHRRTLNGVWGWRKQFIVAPSVYTGAKKNDEKNSLGTLINKNHNREKILNCFFNFLHIFFRIFSGNSIFQKNIKKLIFSGNSIFRRELFPFFFSKTRIHLDLEHVDGNTRTIKMDVTITISAHESNVYRSNPRASAIRTAVNFDEIDEICRESRKKSPSTCTKSPKWNRQSQKMPKKRQQKAGGQYFL